MFTLRHVQPLLFVLRPIVLLVKRHRFRIDDTGVRRLEWFRLLCVWCGRLASPSIVHIRVVLVGVLSLIVLLMVVAGLL